MYDDTKLEPISVGSGILLTGTNLISNLHYDYNKIRISWAGINDIADKGELCSLYFNIKAAASGKLNFNLEKVKLYDENNLPLHVQTSGVSADIKTSSPDMPIVSLSNIASTNTAEVYLKINKSSFINGGSLTVVYDSSKLKLNNAYAGELFDGKTLLINEALSQYKIRFSWADTVPLHEAGNIAVLNFSVKSGASGFADISLDNFKLYDDNAEPVDANISNGGIFIGEQDLAIINSTANKIGETVTFTIDGFNYSEQTIDESVMIVALYNDKHFIKVHIVNVEELKKEVKFSKKFDVTTAKDCNKYKIMMFSSLKNLKPLITVFEGKL